MVQIRKARRSATKLRLLLTGPSGSGKTWGALQIAKGLGGRCVVIDTEEGSSDLYDHLHDFDVIDLKPPFTPERYIEAITAAEEAGYDVIVVDSVTHCWSGPGGCLELLEDVAKAQFRGNTWSAFSVITPRWRAFVDKLLRSPAHVICSGRSKTETAQVDDHGRKKVAKLGMKLEARDGLEFEFTLVLDLIHDGHYATVSKDRTGLFAGDPKPITAETGKRIAEWLAGGQAVAVTDDQAVVEGAMDAIIDATTPTRIDAIVAGIGDRLAQQRITKATADRLRRMATEKRTEIENDSTTTAFTA